MCSDHVLSVAPRYCGEVPLDMSNVLRQSSPLSPILINYSAERESAEKLFFEFASKKQAKTLVAHLPGGGAGEERTVKSSRGCSVKA